MQTSKKPAEPKRRERVEFGANFGWAGWILIILFLSALVYVGLAAWAAAQ